MLISVIQANADNLAYHLKENPKMQCPLEWIDELEQACLLLDNCMQELDNRVPKET